MAARAAASRLPDIARRLGTALIMGAITLGVVIFGGVWWLGLALGAVAALAAAEFYAITRREHRLPNEVFGLVAAAAMPVCAALWGSFGLTAAVAALLAASLAWHVAFGQVRSADTAVTVFGAVYTGFTLAHLVLLRGLDAGSELVLAVILSVWANDVFAYLVGSTLGRHKLAPSISPNKSWEGLLAGSVLTLAVWAGVHYVADTGVSLPAFLLVGLAISIASITGDLAESRMKREAGVKDSGRLLPGHGGFLDRYDSMFLVSLTAYYVLMIAGAR